MNLLLILMSVVFLAIFQFSVLSFFSIWGIVINVFILICIALAIRRWDEYAPLWVGIGGLSLDFLNSGQFGLYTLSLGTTYLIIRWLSVRISILIEKQYLTAIWVFVGVLYFNIAVGLILLLSGEITNIFSYGLIIIKSQVIHMLLYIPIDYIIKIFYLRKLNKSQINL
ncbi:MAG: hypothetical protein ABH837_04000 [bacterium]